MLNLKSESLRSKTHATLNGVASTSKTTIASMVIPTAFSFLAFYFMFDVTPFYDGDVYAASGSLFWFYVWCSIGYLVSMVIAIVGAMLVEEINLTTKLICIIMFTMVADNLVMALDALDLMTWSALEKFDSMLQIACGMAFLSIGVLCLITKLWRYAYRYFCYPYGY